MEEDRVELVVNDKGGHEEIRHAVEELKVVSFKDSKFESHYQFEHIIQIHPYEEVAYDVYRLEDF